MASRTGIGPVPPLSFRPLMPQEPNKTLRLLVPLGLLILGIGVVIAVSRNTGRQAASPTPATTPTTAPTTAPTTTAPAPSPQTTAAAPQAPANAGSASPAATPASPAQPASALDGLTAQTFAPAALTPVGSLEASSPFEAQIQFSSMGAGVSAISLTRHFETIEKKQHTVIQEEQSYTPPGGATETVTPLAALGLEVEGRVVDLLFKLDAQGKVLPVWRETSPGVFEAEIINGAGAKVARVERRYTLTPGSFTIRLSQTVTNLTGGPLTFKWLQFGPVDLQDDAAGYGGDKRRVRFGYLYPPEVQKADPTVMSDEYRYARQRLLGKKGPNGYYDEVQAIWPNTLSTKENFRIVWLGVTNRYFGTALFPVVDAAAGPDAKVFRPAAKVDRVLVQRVTAHGYDPLQILRTTSEPYRVEAGASVDVSMGVYAGPLERPLIRKDAAAAPIGLDGFVLYNFGGMCAPCTFSFLTGFLLGLLHFLHTYITFDWALSIMVLVLIVRTLLHPVTKWSQIRLQRFGKQMQGMAPKQKKIQEKYKDDPKKMREEMGKLWREEGINPTGALGCIPMFLQMPVWIAMYATLFFAIELRHQGAFFGVFQSVLSGHPKLLGYFLGDLAQPDRFYYFGRAIFDVPILGPISSINILPVVLGVVFFIQQKYLTPPPTTPLTPEQEQQQKMMKWMMVFMFPIMMYNAPSGLALYFITNSTLGILESRYIRAHITKYDLLTPKTPGGAGGAGRGGAKPGGFLARLQKLVEERQKQVLKAKGQYPPRKRV